MFAAIFSQAASGRQWPAVPRRISSERNHPCGLLPEPLPIGALPDRAIHTRYLHPLQSLMSLTIRHLLRAVHYFFVNFSSKVFRCSSVHGGHFSANTSIIRSYGRRNVAVASQHFRFSVKLAARCTFTSL